LDIIAQCLSVVKEQLDEVNAQYLISITSPTRNLSKLDEDNLYVIRQQLDDDGVYHLIAAAKMGKEKC